MSAMAIPCRSPRRAFLINRAQDFPERLLSWHEADADETSLFGHPNRGFWEQWEIAPNQFGTFAIWSCARQLYLKTEDFKPTRNGNRIGGASGGDAELPVADIAPRDQGAVIHTAPKTL